MISRNWIKNLFKEINAWVEEKIVEPVQAEKIKARYSKALEYNRLVSTIFIVGSILVGLGIILFIASNWQHLGKPFKVGLIFSFILCFNLLGYYFRFEKGNYPKLGEALLFLGAVSFGSGIWLIAQIFQLPYGHANSLLFWIIGILPIAVLLHSDIILVLSSILLPIWLGVTIRNNPSNIVYQFFLLLATIVYFTYRQKQKTCLFINIISMLIWLSHYLYTQLVSKYHYSIGIGDQLLYTNIFIAFGFVLYGLGISHHQNKNFSSFSLIYKLFGITLILINNYLMTFSHHYGESYGAPKSLNIFYIPPLILLVYQLYFLSAVISSKYIFKFHTKEENKEAKIILLFLFLQAALIHLGSLTGAIVSLSYNILLFVEIIAFLYLGYLLREEFIFRLSLYVFAIDILTRYFDTFWKILPRSMFFILGGLILIFGGIYMERKRKDIEKKMGGKPLEETT